jgi:hypothetical protein
MHAEVRFLAAHIIVLSLNSLLPQLRLQIELLEIVTVAIINTSESNPWFDT